LVDKREFERWWEAAASARESAVLQAGSEHHHWACFLAEQAAQLATKGLLHGMGAGAWGHDLVELGSRVEAATGEELKEEIAGALQRLSRHYIPTRYPDAHPSGPPGIHYGAEDVRRALDDLAEVLNFLQSTWMRLAKADEGGGES
jgi:HEPN domain-containing protein